MVHGILVQGIPRIVAVTRRDGARVCVRDHGAFAPCHRQHDPGDDYHPPPDYRPRHGDATINARAN